MKLTSEHDIIQLISADEWMMDILRAVCFFRQMVYNCYNC